MITYIGYFCFIGEPAQALPGFKGEIVSVEKENLLFTYVNI
jgi:hypothetical protein